MDGSLWCLLQEHAGLAAAAQVAEGRGLWHSECLRHEKFVRTQLLEHVPASNPEAQVKLLYLCLFLIKARISLDRQSTETVLRSVSDFLQAPASASRSRRL
ncbi:hypothetical protein [Pseudorhizobium pelagicum]|uniref:Uncharacterized protein n=1 Tax=Pseudorhizobium pelagicum TaxID=1509405 RepID=A0A922NZS7_9HYPH|nr:hypothetical protein [Pseudorhizobium pelagicum]KEQ04757.1 hypothetical protein GV68_12250 [Pseudorhizobium pelagicum]KEQ07358.1 hypothetical protein GV67_21475 [Pseudorhizobium pelagicum]